MDDYFIALLKSNDLIFTSWKIDDPKWKEIIREAESGQKKRDYLFINIYSFENDKYVKIESIPVFGIENNWHVFLKNEYSGRNVILRLCYRDKKGKYFDIMESGSIDIPVIINENIAMKDKAGILYKLSGVNPGEDQATSR